MHFLSVIAIAPGSPCAKKARKEDPFDIFVFDLTSSPEEESYNVGKTNITSTKAVPKHPVKIHATRSKKINHVGARKVLDPEKTMDQRREASTQGNLSFKVVKGNTGDSSLRGKAIPTLNCKDAKGTDEKSRGHSDATTHAEHSTPNRPIKSSLENGIPRSKVAQNVFQVIFLTLSRHKTLSTLLILAVCRTRVAYMNLVHGQALLVTEFFVAQC